MIFSVQKMGDIFMAKKEKNSFEKICDKLEENYILGENQITYVKKYFKSDLKISEDKDMLLKIKAEAEEADYNNLLSLMFSMLAVCFTAIGVIIQFLPEMPNNIDLLIRIAYLIAIIILLISALKMLGGKYTAIKKWRQYVLCALNQLSEEQTEIQNERIDKPIKKKNKKQKGSK